MKFLVVDDHALVQEGLASIIHSLEPGAEVFVANSCGMAMQLAEEEQFDFAFLDLQLPDKPGFFALEQFKEHYPLTSVVVVSAQEDKATVFRAVESGAKAFVPKSSDTQKMRAALKTLIDGRIYLPECLIEDLPLPGHTSRTREAASKEWNLTERQKEVLALLIAGLSNKLIARKLNIVESTVKIHVSAILRELKVATRTQAIIAVARYGIQLPPVLH